MEGKIDGNGLKYETNKYVYDFKNFGYNTFNGKVTISEADEKRINLPENILTRNNKTKPRSIADKEKKTMLLKVRKLFMRIEN